MLLGDSGVGKTCLLVRFRDGTFLSGNFISTVGIDFRVSAIPLIFAMTKNQMCINVNDCMFVVAIALCVVTSSSFGCFYFCFLSRLLVLVAAGTNAQSAVSLRSYTCVSGRIRVCANGAITIMCISSYILVYPVCILVYPSFFFLLSFFGLLSFYFYVYFIVVHYDKII